MTRLEKISSYISDNEKVLDVGCDQALLSKILAKRKIYSIASDLRPNIIENAKKNLTPLEKEYITFSVSNGVPTILNEEYTLVLSGMGAHTILDILKNSNYRFNKIITISNNNNDILRTEMSKLNYYDLEEEIIKEMYNLSLIFPREYLCTVYLIAISKKHSLFLKADSIYDDILKELNVK